MTTQKNKMTNAAASPTPNKVAMPEHSTKGGASLVVRDLRDEYGEVIAGKLQAKLTIIQVAKQRLAEADDTFRDASEKAAAAKSIVADVATQLYQARRDDILPDAELSAVLGDIFGYKAKKDGTPSATPNGAGETIRKYVRFLTAAREAVGGDNVGRAFATLDADQMERIAVVVASVDSGDISVHTAFDNIADIRKVERVTVEKAIDPKHIAGLADVLSQPGMADVLRNSEALIAAYTMLRNVTDAAFKVAETTE